ncbi:MAG TPA: DUF502 domain-containing protein [Chitinophagales bacterium]|nr:DUF502 domain-containing protein [Chitinophagales bacterium]
MTRFFRRITGYFFRGLLFAAPIFITLYVLFLFFEWMDGLIHGLFPHLWPGGGILILLAFITFVGFLTKLFFFNAVMGWLEDLFGQTPITKLMYSSIKDLFSAFIGDKKKMFSQPVMVMLFKEAGIRKLGFVTKENLSSLGLTDLVAVYFPHSYNFSGNLYLVPRENITPMPQLHGADAMKFIVSGGVTEI